MFGYGNAWLAERLEYARHLGSRGFRGTTQFEITALDFVFGLIFKFLVVYKKI